MFGIGSSTGSINFPMSYDYGSDYGATSGEGKHGWSSMEKLLCTIAVILTLTGAGLIAAVVILAVQLKGSTPLSSGITVKSLCDTQECVEAASDILRAMNHEVSPCTDFYTFACGGWAKEHPIPITTTQWGQFEILRNRMGERVRDLLEEDDTDESGMASHNVQKNYSVSELDPPESFRLAQDFYESCLDQDPDGIADNSELTELLDTVIGSSDTFSFLNITNVLADIRRKLEGNYLFSMFVDLDERNTSNYVIYLDQPVLSISQQYLLEPENNFMRNAYFKLIEAVWKIVFPEDEGRAGKIAADILRIEMALANISTRPEDRRNVTSTYNPVNFGQLVNLTSMESFLDWSTYFKEVFRGIPGDVNASMELDYNETLNGPFDDEHFLYETALSNDSETLNFENLTYIVKDVKFFERLGTALDLRYNQRDVLNLLKWRIIFDYGVEVNSRLRSVFFQFVQATQGLRIPRPRWRVCAEKTNALFGMAISFRYVEKYFPEQRIETAKTLVQDIRKAFKHILHESDWLDPETRAIALKKISKMKEFIGFPDWLEDRDLLQEHYYGLDRFYAPESHFSNFLQAAHWHYRRNLAKIFEQKDPDEWIVDPTIVNAFYSFSHNSINFPAGILQIPFFNMPLQALNYGGIGVIIGHEITHGFDDRGRESDADGNVKSWWRNATLKNYLDRSECFVKQYSNYSLKIDDEVLHIDGRQTLGENIADNGGLRQAFEAYRLYVARNGEEPSLPGLGHYTSEQLFYLSYAQIWCEAYSPNSLKQQILNGVHSPNQIRVRGAIENSPEFARTWKCKPPAKTCKIW